MRDEEEWTEEEEKEEEEAAGAELKTKTTHSDVGNYDSENSVLLRERVMCRWLVVREGRTTLGRCYSVSQMTSSCVIAFQPHPDFNSRYFFLDFSFVFPHL